MRHPLILKDPRPVITGVIACGFKPAFFNPASIRGLAFTFGIGAAFAAFIPPCRMACIFGAFIAHLPGIQSSTYNHSDIP
jgi:hypothetical protein